MPTGRQTQAIVLAAGRGRRMRPLSDETHKALLQIGDTSILDRIVHALVEAGVAPITIVTGYRAEEVRTAVLTRHPAADVRFVHSDRWAETNNIVSFSLGLEHADPERDIVLVECDLLLDPALVRAVCNEHDGNVALVDRYATGMDGTVVTIREGVVARVIGPDEQGADFDYSQAYKTLNVYRFGRRFCQRTLRPLLDWYIREVGDRAYYELVLGMLVGLPGQPIAAEVVPPGSWAEVDDPNDLATARFRFQPEQRAAILDATLGGHWAIDVLDFAHMRNAHFPPPSMLAALRHALPDVLASYGSRQEVVDRKLAWVAGCAAEHVVALNGAAQAYPLLARLWAGRRAAVPAPTFGEYRRVFPDAVPYTDAPGIELEELDRLAGEVEVLVVVNPNNPTGTTLPTAELYALAARHPETRVLVDESFIAFSDQPSLVDRLEVSPLANVAVLTSLSKVLGVPGARLGSLYSRDAALLHAVRRELPVWNGNSVAEHLLELTLKFRDELDASLRRTASDRAAFASSLRELRGVAVVHPSGGDFLLVDLDGPAALGVAVRARLLETEAIEVKDVSARFESDVARLRVAVRDADDNARFVTALGSVLLHIGVAVR